jgi:DNA-binding NarL/FixJ family response regulator
MTRSSKKQPHDAEAPKIRVLVADDHVTVLEGLVAIINRQSDMTIVAQASNGHEATDLWRSLRPDVALLDLRMPVMDGVAVIEEIRRDEPQARFIVLTTFDTDADISRAIKAGAKGYLLKDSPREELLTCIREVNDGETRIPAALIAKLAASLSSEALTGRELEVLAFLAQGKSNKEIATKFFISETTVKSHLRSIFTKLKVLSRTEAVAAASRRGLIQM